MSKATTVVSSFISSFSSTNLSFKLDKSHHFIGSIFNSVHSGKIHVNASTFTVTSLYVFSHNIGFSLYFISSTSVSSPVPILTAISHVNSTENHVNSTENHVNSSTIVHVSHNTLSPVNSSTSQLSISETSHVHCSTTSHVEFSISSQSLSSSQFFSSTENSGAISLSPSSSTLTSSDAFPPLISRISSYSHA
jgi:hypothetical protein